MIHGSIWNTLMKNWKQTSRQIAFPRGATHGSGHAGNTAPEATYEYLHWDRCAGWGRESAVTRTTKRKTA